MQIWQTVITVVATLAGAFGGTIVGGVIKNRSDRAARVHEWQVTMVEIYRELMTALSDHRAKMWDVEAARLHGDEAEIAATSKAMEATRAAVTGPHEALVILAPPQLCEQIDAAVQATYAIDTWGNPERTQELLDRRLREAKSAHKQLARATAAVMRELGAGLPR